MSAPPSNPKTAALEALIEAHAGELKLPTIKARFRAMAEQATREQQTPIAYLAALLEAETHERSERRERRRLMDARFPAIKRLEEFRFADNPKIPQATIAALAEGSWIRDRESIIFVGDSGTGKTHLATALVVCACQQGRRVRSQQARYRARATALTPPMQSGSSSASPVETLATTIAS
jgi:DNA replication protein DnaC